MNKLILTLCSLLSISTHAKMMHNLESRFGQRWNYVSICDFAYHNEGDHTQVPFKNISPFNPKDVFPGSVIFLTGHGAPSFFKDIHPQIKHPYIIFYMFGGLYGPILDDPKIIHFFCAGGDGGLKNNHPKYSYAPLGIYRDPAIFHNQEAYNNLFQKLRTKKKTKLAYLNITLHSWATWRHEIFNQFKDMPYVVTINGRKSFSAYMEEMAECKFTISPRGDVVDCYRHWEAIMVGTIPIMQRSQIDELFDDLPVLIIDDWNQVTEEFLEQKYKEISSKSYDLSKLYLKYWVDQINTIKKVHGLL